MKSYDNIWNPLTKKLVKTKSNIGKKILNNYIKCINSKKKDNKYSKILNVLSNKFIYSYKKTGKELINNYIKYLNIKYVGGDKVHFKRNSGAIGSINITNDSFLNYATKESISESESDKITKQFSRLIINSKLNLKEGIFELCITHILQYFNNDKQNSNNDKQNSNSSRNVSSSIINSILTTVSVNVRKYKNKIINSIMLFFIHYIENFTATTTLIELLSRIHSSNISVPVVRAKHKIEDTVSSVKDYFYSLFQHEKPRNSSNQNEKPRNSSNQNEKPRNSSNQNEKPRNSSNQNDHNVIGLFEKIIFSIIFGILQFIGLNIDETDTITYTTIKDNVKKYLKTVFLNTMEPILHIPEIKEEIHNEIQSDTDFRKLTSCHKASKKECTSVFGKHYVSYRKRFASPEKGWHYCIWDDYDQKCKSKRLRHEKT